MNNRRLARAQAFQSIYATSFHTEVAFEEETIVTKGLSKKDALFVKTIVQGVLSELSILDMALQEFSPKRKMDRFPKVELSILRMAAWELMHPQADTPASIVINEAVILAKQFGEEGTFRYINGILHNFSKSRG